MMQRTLLFPKDARKRLARRYESQRSAFLAGEFEWPLVLPLGALREKDVQNNGALVRKWVHEWEAWNGPGCVEWQERRWPVMGTQRIPKSLCFTTADEVIACVGAQEEWARALRRYRRFTAQWPTLAPLLVRRFDVLADYSEEDGDRLFALLAWLVENPASNRYIRQLPVPGVDSKWFERHYATVHRLFLTITGKEPTAHDYEFQAFRLPPKLIRIRLLDSELRTVAGGLSDITAPVEELARLPIAPRCAFVVENMQTGLAFGDLPGTALIMGLGYAVEALGELPWLSGLPVVYWGDLDTHGFAILSRARTFLPQIASCLMDADTLLAYKTLWGEEPSQHIEKELPGLTPDEQDVYHGLQCGRWGANVRLEQERICWDAAWRKIQEIHALMVNARP